MMRTAKDRDEKDGNPAAAYREPVREQVLGTLDFVCNLQWIAAAEHSENFGSIERTAAEKLCDYCSELGPQRVSPDR